MISSSRRRHRDDDAFDDDAIWRGEIPDDQIIMTAVERASIDAEAALRRRRHALVELFGEPVGSVTEGHDTLRHQRRGAQTRQGNLVDQRRSAGCREEIQVTVLAHPITSVELIADHGFLDAVDSVVVDRSTERRADKQISWDARLKTTPWSSRPVRLRLYGSPSSNVTVLTLTPRRSRRFGVRLFLNSGLRSLFSLRDAVESAVESTVAHSGRT